MWFRAKEEINAFCFMKRAGGAGAGRCVFETGLSKLNETRRLADGVEWS
jgi:hypothetical protein